MLLACLLLGCVYVCLHKTLPSQCNGRPGRRRHGYPRLADCRGSCRPGRRWLPWLPICCSPCLCVCKCVCAFVGGKKAAAAAKSFISPHTHTQTKHIFPRLTCADIHKPSDTPHPPPRPLGSPPNAMPYSPRPGNKSPTRAHPAIPRHASYCHRQLDTRRAPS